MYVCKVKSKPINIDKCILIFFCLINDDSDLKHSSTKQDNITPK